MFYSGHVEADALVPETVALANGPADTPVFEPFREAYQAISPDGPDHWPVVFDKVATLWRTEPHIPLPELGALRPRTLLLFPDDDIITLEHAVALFGTIPDAALAVLPGTSHLAHLEKPALFGELVSDFLRLDPQPTLAPIARASVTV